MTPMIDPLVARLVNVRLGAEGRLSDSSWPAGRRAGGQHAKTVRICCRLDEVLPDLWPDVLEEEAEVRQDRVVALNRSSGLRHVDEAHERQNPLIAIGGQVTQGARNTNSRTRLPMNTATAVAKA